MKPHNRIIPAPNRSTQGVKIFVREKMSKPSREPKKFESNHESVLMGIGYGVVTVDRKRKITYANTSFEEMTGWKAQEIIGKSIDEIIPREDASGKRVSFDELVLVQVFSGQKFVADVSNPFYYIRKDKSRFPASAIVTPIIQNKKIVGAVEVFREISKEKEIDRAKTEFVSLASHQLRTPLSTVNWYCEMLLDGDVGVITLDQRKYLEEIYSGNQRMVDLVNTLLDVSRIELGTFFIESKLTDVIKITQSVINEQKVQIKEKKIVCSSLFEKDVPLIHTDPKLIRMVLQNLLSNAIKYTPNEGVITISLAVHSDNNVLITITDTGYGIPEDQKEKIFTKFFRADNVLGKDTEGTGLGLYIAKSIIVRAGGELWFESEENKGTVFYATLPLEKRQRERTL